VRFEQGSAAALSLPDASVDVVVSFETIEHLPRADQPRMLAEIARVLCPDGVLIMSAPNPVEYSDARNYRNPFHVHEPDRAELEALIAVALPAQRWFRQRRYFGSALWSEIPGDGVEAWEGDRVSASAAQPPAAMYFVVVAARSPVTLPANVPMLSLFSDRGEAELARLDHEAREVLRLDALLRDRDSALERLGAERNELARQRNTLEEERDEASAQLASARDGIVAYRAECDRLDRAVTAQERIIAYRQSARWWVSLPWLRLRLWWQRFRAL
jgi:SAM-dependent methyltransferase